MSATLEHVDLPMLRMGVMALFCSGPRRDGRFALHRVSPSEPPFAFAWECDGRWRWSDADDRRQGDAASLTDCLRAAHID